MISERPVLTIVSNADQRFLPGLEAAVASAMAAASGGYDYDFRIIDGGLDPRALEELAETIGKIAAKRGVRASLAPLPIDQSRLMVLPERRGSRMTYAKMVLPEELADLDSIIYLDADVLCFAGIEDVRPPEEAHDVLLAGARDFFWVIQKDCPWIDQVPPDERQLPYINAGIMWMNLKGLREIGFTEKSITARAAIPNARQGDQAVFNFLCRGRSHILPDRINHRTSIGANGLFNQGDFAVNIHYIGAPKPWLGPPTTSTWFVHQLWHQAYKALFPERGVIPPGPGIAPTDLGSIWLKSLVYRVLNPKRSKQYRVDLASCHDPQGILKKAGDYWKEKLGTA